MRDNYLKFIIRLEQVLNQLITACVSSSVTVFSAVALDSFKTVMLAVRCGAYMAHVTHMI